MGLKFGDIRKMEKVEKIKAEIERRTGQMNNVFISLAKKNEVVENFAKSKKVELEKMIPGFIDDKKFIDIVLNFYERGIREGAQMMLELMTENAMNGICISNGAECGASIESSAGMLFFKHNTLDVGDKVKIIIIKEE